MPGSTPFTGRSPNRGQTPEVMVIACCDSRAAPETIFSAAPGGNLRPPQCRQPGAALRTGRRLPRDLRGPGVRRAEPQGPAHRRAWAWAMRWHPRGAATGDGAAVSGRLHRQMDESSPPRRRRIWRPAPGSAMANARPPSNAPRSAARSTTCGPSRASRSSRAANRLGLHGAWFDIADGELWTMSADTGDFFQVGVTRGTAWSVSVSHGNTHLRC